MDLIFTDEGGVFINLRKKSISLDVGVSNEYAVVVENRAFCVIRPDDVRPYLRTPYFLIVESDNSSSFLVKK
uniref:Uncharacterized protein n=1 Tax=Romanomermis culicivorax TaxID=13658 RepID=A0A915ICU8_ROMCU